MSKLQLNALNGYIPFPGPLVFVIMDGVGIGKGGESDGVHLAHTPFLDTMFRGNLYTQLKAHGTAVGQPSDGDMGNSEVGHLNLGAGRIVYQDLTRITKAIEDGSLAKNPRFNKALKLAKGKRLHFIGLLSDADHIVRADASSTLGECQMSGRIAAALTETLQDSSASVRRAARKALENQLASADD